jgi:hypothetical protein
MKRAVVSPEKTFVDQTAARTQRAAPMARRGAATAHREARFAIVRPHGLE